MVLRIFFLNEIQMCTTVRCKNKDDDDAVFRLGWVFIFKVFLLLLKINSRERERVPGVSSSHVIWPCTSSLMFYRNIIIKILSINSIILFFLFFFRAVVFFFFPSLTSLTSSLRECTTTIYGIACTGNAPFSFFLFFSL